MCLVLLKAGVTLLRLPAAEIQLGVYRFKCEWVSEDRPGGTSVYVIHMWHDFLCIASAGFSDSLS